MIRFILFALVLGVAPIASAQSNKACERCHDDESMSTSRYGVQHSLHIVTEHLEGTPHEGMDCIECHQDLAGRRLPHAKRLGIPECGACHEDAQEEFVEGFFKPLRDKGYTSIPTCVGCHGSHKVSATGQPRKVCGVCHQDILQEFSGSAHWDTEDSDDPEVTCVSCHSPHFKHEKGSMPSAKWRIHVTEACRDCHEAEVEGYDKSGHYKQVLAGNPNAPICSDCHAKHKVLSPRNPESVVSVARLDLTCTRCHKGFERSVPRPEKNDDPRLETCVVCHTGHSTEMVNSPIFEEHLTRTCLRCHRDGLTTGENAAHGGIHRKQIETIDRGGQAECGKCHEYHYRAPKHTGTHGRKNACGECHEKQRLEYEKSTHFISREKGHPEAPGCIDCHDERRVTKADVQFTGQNIVKLCGRCHADSEVTLNFQLNPDVLKGYNTSYHGQMYQLGFQGEKFATCVSCHDNHSILPSDHPDSTIGRAHIMETCGKCHKNVNENFVGYLQHYSPMEKEANPLLGYIHVFMIWLLGVTMVIFGGHTLLWLLRLLVGRVKDGPLKKKSPSGLPTRVQRFGKPERLLHLGMVSSFLILAATGLPLKYAHTEMATWFVHKVVGFGTAALLHRAAAMLLFAVFLIHVAILVWRLAVKRQKGLLWGSKSLVPHPQDAVDFVEHIKYFLGIRKEQPPFGRWTYWEKFDYFAVFWGVLVIGASGVTLMFPEFFTVVFPGWLLNAAHIIHSEEALLATAFIFTVHFFNTHLRPGVFPMDEVIFTGRMTEAHFLHERAREREEMTEEEWKAAQTKPLPKWQRRLYYFAGYFFLSVGTLLLVLIVLGALS